MQHQAGGGGYGHLQGGGGGAAAEVEVAMSEDDQKLGDLGIAEAASPISSRPPAPTNANFEEMIQATAEAGGGASSSSNRWPRQETLALLQIRSEMDTAFRDATLKGPLWDQVSSKLGELGYKRSAKKCKEKFENVHKYYKRTKEGRGGRQDGKSYKFFSQLEALHHSTTAAATAAAAFLPRSAPPPTSAAAASFPPPSSVMPQRDALVLPPDHRIRDDPIATAALFGISFSSDSSSDGEEDDDDDDEMEMDMDLEMGGERREQRKRKRSHGGGSDSDEKMMDFFEGLLKQVMQKQEAMQQRFLEAIEKREQDRMIREEAWKRQDMARIAREHELMAQERAVSASRDAAIIEFLEKITGQNIVLPSNTVVVPQNPVVPRSEAQQSSERQNRRRDQPPSDPPPPTPTPPPPPQSVQVTEAAIQPLQDLGGGGGGGGMDFAEASSSRWPKVQVLELIKIRSSMEARYQEAGPKGPLWEEISAAMKRIGYSRSAKRCKEKWENINKYFKKVKESNKKRPQDAKTCPYFNELDALYRKKILKYSAGGSGSTSFSQQEEHVGVLQLPPQSLAGNIVSSEDHKADELQTSGDAFGEHSHNTNIGGETQPEDMLNKGHDQESRGETTENNNYNNVHCSNSDDLDEDIYDEVDDNQEYDDDDKTEEEMKMVYKIQFQRQNVASSNGAGTSAPAPSSFVAMVQ